MNRSVETFVDEWVITYRRLLLAVLVVNIVVLVDGVKRWQIDDGTALSAASALTLGNLAGAVLIRQQTVLNALYGLAGRLPRASPLWLRPSSP